MRTISLSRTPSACRGHLATATVAALLSVVVGACGGGGDGAPTQPQPAAVASVTVALSASTARVGEPVTATATLRDASGQPVTGRAVTWVSSAPAVATVDGAGAITTLTPGSTMISATSEGRSGSATLTVLAPVVVTLAVVDGDRQQARAGTSVVVPPVIVARDASGGAAGGIRLRFTVLSGGGSVGAAVVTTDASGRASPGGWTLGSALGEQQLEVGAADGSVSVTAPVRIRATAVGPNEPVTAPVRSYTIAAGAAFDLADTVTGSRFRFPQGGTGTLEIARVAEALPGLPSSARQMVVRFSGSQPVLVAGVAAPGGLATAYAWGVRTAIATAGPGGPRWWAIAPVDVQRDTAWFRLPPLEAAAGGFGPLGRWAASTAMAAGGTLSIVDEPAILGLVARVGEARAEVARTIEWWLSHVSSSSAAEIRRNMAALPYVLVGGGTGAGYYQYALGSWWTPTIYVNVARGAVEQAARHEAGHYLTHMLLGTDRYQSLEAYTPGADHVYGKPAYGFRNSLIEDYTYLAQHLMQGHLDQYDFCSTTRVNNWYHVLRHFPPDRYDAPSAEGFGAAMALALTRGPADTLVYDFSADGHQSRAPAFGVTARQLMDVLAAGPSTPMALRDLLVPLAGGDVGMAAVVEPLGWSYRTRGRLLASDGQPLAGVQVASVVRVQGKDYATPRVTTASDGSFTLTRTYPGSSTVRMYRPAAGGGTDSLDVGSITVAWETPTNQQVQVPDLRMPATAGLNNIMVVIDGFTLTNALPNGNTCYLTSMGAINAYDGVFAPIAWSGNRFVARGQQVITSASNRTTYTVDIAGEISVRSADTVMMTVSGNATQQNEGKRYLPDGITWTWVELWRRGITFDVRDVPLAVSASTGWSGNRSGPSAIGHIASAAMYDIDHDLGHNGLYARNCSSTGIAPARAVLRIVVQQRP
jgi:hypothetical protein